MRPTISIGILSWGSPLTFKNTLRSYISNNLFEHVADVTVFFNEITKNDIRLARKFALPFCGMSQNVGIGRGLDFLARNARAEYFLFLENDWELIENPDITRRRLETSVLALESHQADVVRLRHRQQYGEPLYTLQFKDNEVKHSDHLLDCVHWVEDPSAKFPQKIIKQTINLEDWFFTTARYGNYTNNPCLYRTEFVRKNICPHTAGRDVSLELDIHEWWRLQEFKISQGPGLFSHKRIDPSGSRCRSRSILWLRSALFCMYRKVKMIPNAMGSRNCDLRKHEQVR